MISASGAEAHRFGRVRRNGYDPAEVDAVVARLVDTLRSYESKTQDLERRLEEADASADAIRRTFVAAEATRGEILEEAETTAAEIRTDAERKAEQTIEEAQNRAAGLIASAESESAAMAELADRLDHEIAKRRNEILAATQEEVDAVMADAEWAAARQKVAAAEEADRILVEAAHQADLQRSAAILSGGYASLAGARLAAAAIERADRIIDEAEHDAASIVEDAQAESADLRRHAAVLRSAIADLQESAVALATMTAEQASSFDVTVADSAPEIADDRTAEQADAAVAHGSSTEAGHADVDETDGGHDAPADHERLDDMADEGLDDGLDTGESALGAADEVTDWAETTVDEGDTDDADVEPSPATPSVDVPATVDVTDDDAPSVSLEPTDAEEVSDTESDEVRTYYQRSTGIPLSERIKIARKSG